MSAYGKSQQPEYDARTPSLPPLPSSQGQQSQYTQPAYGGYVAQSQYDLSSSTPSSARHRPLAHEQSGDHESLHEQSSYAARQFDATQPQILHYAPDKGTEGMSLSMYFQSGTNPQTDSRSYRIMFGSTRRSTTLSAAEGQAKDVYQLTAEVPPHAETGWLEGTVTIYMVIENEQGEELGTMDVGPFRYTDIPGRQSYGSPSRTAGKRKRSTELVEGPLPKRPSSQPLRPKSEDYGTYGYGPGQYPSYGTNTSGERSYSIYGSYGNPDQHSATTYHQPHASPRHYGYHYGSTDSSHAPSNQSTHAWTHPASVAVPVRSSPVSANPGITSPIMRPGSPSSLPQAIPKLIRTSTLQQEAQSSSQNASGSSTSSFNPYSIFTTHKAILKLNGDLSDMTSRWTTEEWNSRRRLVQFWRHQDINTIHASFRAVAPEDRPPDSICISCIWWAEKQACFVTSVDCIFLLESLVSVRFTVEEKNRIRRNLEGFRPLTVSKAKAESESFFKLIMGFPTPKPRNIEKDVKVFPWVVLGHALKKIIGKYSASYSSTAGIISPTPGSSAHPGSASGEVSQTGLGDALPRAPASPSTGGSSGALILKRPSSATPPIGTSSGSSAADLPIPSVASAPAVSPHNIWQPRHPTLPAIAVQQSGPPVSRSWEMSYLETNAPSASTSGVYYQRPLLTEPREAASGSEGQSHHIQGSVS